VDLAKHSVSFRFRGEHFALEPIVHVSRQEHLFKRLIFGPVWVHGVGSEIPKRPGGQPVHLFDPDSEPPQGLNKADCLEVFFRYAMKVVIEKLYFRIKPVAEVHGSRILQAPLGGYQQELLRRALLRSGVSHVQFMD
jgi:hypothetical protein